MFSDIKILAYELSSLLCKRVFAIPKKNNLAGDKNKKAGIFTTAKIFI